MVSQHLQLSEEGRGVASIANMLTITRIHNGVSAAAAMRRQGYTHTSSYYFVYTSVRTDYKQSEQVCSGVFEKYSLVCIEVSLCTIGPSKKQLNENRERVATFDATCDWIRRGCDKFVIGPGQ